MRRTMFFALATVALALAGTSIASAEPSRPDTVVTFQSDLPHRYRLTHVSVVVDGTLRYDATSERAIAHLSPGRHVVEVIASYKLHDPLFTYLDRYNVEVRSAHVIQPARDRPRWVSARSVFVGGATTPVERSAAIAWQEH